MTTRRRITGIVTLLGSLVLVVLGVQGVVTGQSDPELADGLVLLVVVMLLLERSGRDVQDE